ncbi:MAG: tripartite tricarboxylate transporter permease [Candidatus Competibacterales bacterium]
MVVGLVADPRNVVVLFAASLMGIVFGALPGLTATLGVALLTTLTYGLPLETALIALLSTYVGAIYGGSYPAILVNIPGTAAAAASAMEGYPLAKGGHGGWALGLTTTASFLGTLVGLLCLVLVAPWIVQLALAFTSVEFCLLALFGIVISGTLTSRDGAIKGWIAGFLGLALAMVGRDRLQFYPRFTFDSPQLDAGIEVVPVLIGAFAIPQIIQVLTHNRPLGTPTPVGRVLPALTTVIRQGRHIVRSALIGVGIGAVPGVGEDIAGWVSYGAAKNTSKNPERFGHGEPAGLVASETANNACIGGALIPLLTLGIPGSPPAAMLLGALMIHGVTAGPMIEFDRPGFILQVTAILLLASVAMWINGMLLARQVVRILLVPAALFMPLVAVLSVIGSYALGLNTFNLYLMLAVGLLAYGLGEMEYPIAPMVIGVILGPMADENLRRALMISEGSFEPFYTRPVALVLLLAIALLVVGQLPRGLWRRCWRLGRAVVKPRAV